MSVEATRMQYLASEFSKKNSGGNTHGPPQLPHPARPLAGREAQAPRCSDPNLGPSHSHLFSRGCARGSKPKNSWQTLTMGDFIFRSDL